MLGKRNSGWISKTREGVETQEQSKTNIGLLPVFPHSPQSQQPKLLLNQSVVELFTSDLLLMAVFLKKAYIDQLLINP